MIIAIIFLLFQRSRNWALPLYVITLPSWNHRDQGDLSLYVTPGRCFGNKWKSLLHHIRDSPSSRSTWWTAEEDWASVLEATPSLWPILSPVQSNQTSLYSERGLILGNQCFWSKVNLKIQSISNYNSVLRVIVEVQSPTFFLKQLVSALCQTRLSLRGLK